MRGGQSTPVIVCLNCEPRITLGYTQEPQVQVLRLDHFTSAGSRRTAEEVRLTLREANVGKTAVLTCAHKKFCEACSGTGEEVVACPLLTFDLGAGPFQAAPWTRCSLCNTAGAVCSFEECNRCKGLGYMITTKKVCVMIPAGTRHKESVIEVKDYLGCRYVLVKVIDDRRFLVTGDVITSRLTISLVRALQGGTVTTTGLYNDRLQVVIPKLTSTGHTISVPNAGPVCPNTGQRGMHKIIIHVSASGFWYEKSKGLQTMLCREQMNQ